MRNTHAVLLQVPSSQHKIWIVLIYFQSHIFESLVVRQQIFKSKFMICLTWQRLSML